MTHLKETKTTKIFLTFAMSMAMIVSLFSVVAFASNSNQASDNPNDDAQVTTVSEENATTNTQLEEITTLDTPSTEETTIVEESTTVPETTAVEESTTIPETTAVEESTPGIGDKIIVDGYFYKISDNTVILKGFDDGYSKSTVIVKNKIRYMSKIIKSE